MASEAAQGRIPGFDELTKPYDEIVIDAEVAVVEVEGVLADK